MDELEVVKAWHGALNERDLDRMLELSHKDVVVTGPRGTGRGHELLREWVLRAGASLSSGRIYHRGGTIVVEEFAQWRSNQTGDVVGTATVASVFEVEGGRVVRLTRFDSLESALSATGLGDRDEVPA